MDKQVIEPSNAQFTFKCSQLKAQNNIHECESFHVTRRKRGRGFEYCLLDGAKISETNVLKRFKTLVIPPMWQEVRISLCEQSKVQAFGYDQRQRKQYIYHQQWEELRQAEKFARLAEFGKHLVDLRKAYVTDLERAQWDLQKTTALALLLLDRTGIRIGNKSYSTQNGTIGLTTLRRKHLEEDESELAFSFTGKHGKQRHIDISDPQAGKLISESASKPGYPLFRYRIGSHWEDLLSDDVNTRLRELLDFEASAKDFRTWTGTRLAMQYAHQASVKANSNKRRKFTACLVKLVAQDLGNTPAVCEKYYIHPKVLSHLQKQYKKSGDCSAFESSDNWLNTQLSPCEKAVLKVIS
ncbi:DNA topoisomerase IB [Glaciecola sp. 2405UD65-10]|uniref:DNA topoisomerase IB n=1 Tax=Glaciecola sp. 2405UD65-10 TaxID=3397244 RepID=UPI003B5AA4B0